MNRKMQRLALAGRWPGLAASGPAGEPLRPWRASRSASPSRPNPQPATLRNSRRLRGRNGCGPGQTGGPLDGRDVAGCTRRCSRLLFPDPFALRLQERRRSLGLERLRLACQHELVGAPDAITGARATLAQHAPGEGPGCAGREIAVQERERLQRVGAGRAAGTCTLRIRRVEGVEERVPDVSLAKQVKGPSPVLGRVRVHGPKVHDLGLGEDQVLDLFFEGCKHTRPTHFRAQLARDGQHGVAYSFGVEPAAVHTGEQHVVRVIGGQLRIGLARLAIQGGGDHQPMQRLLAPASCHDFRGEPVEQLRVGRGLAARAEVAGRRHDSAAEVMLPEPVDDDARREGIVRAGQPLRQRRATAGLVCVGETGGRCERCGRLRGQHHAGGPRGDLRTAVRVLAAAQDEGVGRLRFLIHQRHRVRGRPGERPLDLKNRALEPLATCVVGRIGGDGRGDFLPGKPQ
jgi:hypothetical protein